MTSSGNLMEKEAGLGRKSGSYKFEKRQKELKRARKAKEKMERMDSVFEYCKDIKICKSTRVVANDIVKMNTYQPVLDMLCYYFTLMLLWQQT